MDGLKALIYLTAVIIFTVVLIKKKAVPFLKKKVLSGTSDALSEKGAGYPSQHGKEVRCEVLSFSTYDNPDPKDFGNQIEARLECELTRLANRQKFYHVDYVPLDGVLLLFIRYEV